MSEAPRNTKETAAYLSNLVKTGSNDWYRKCLIVQRTARGIPPVYPTAYTASQAVPKSERITKISDLRRGMVAFSYDPRISGTAGHIFFINGRTKDGTILTTSNDVKTPGGMDVVPFDFYSTQWGQQFQFGSTWLNGYDFSTFSAPAKPVHEGGLGEQYNAAIEEVEAIYRQKLAKLGEDNLLVKHLKKDLDLMKVRASNWKPE